MVGPSALIGAICKLLQDLAFGMVVSGALPFNDSTAVLAVTWPRTKWPRTVYIVNQNAPFLRRCSFALAPLPQAPSSGMSFTSNAPADGTRHAQILRSNGVMRCRIT
jgi:hypothetical protein